MIICQRLYCQRVMFTNRVHSICHPYFGASNIPFIPSTSTMTLFTRCHFVLSLDGNISKFRLRPLHLCLKKYFLLHFSNFIPSYEETVPSILLARKSALAKGSPPVRHVKEASSVNSDGPNESEEKPYRQARRIKHDKAKTPQTEEEKRKEEYEKRLKETEDKLIKEYEKEFGKEKAEAMRESLKQFRKFASDGNRGILAFLAFITLAFFLLINSISSKSHALLRDASTGAPITPVKITWSNFLQKIATSGQIDKIVVFDNPGFEDQRRNRPKMGTVMIQMKPGAKTRDGTPLALGYLVNVPELHRLESSVRNAEMGAGLTPDEWANIHWIRPSILMPIIGFMVMIVILFGPLLWFIRSMRRSGGILENISSMMRHNIHIFDPASKEGKKALKIKFRDVAGLHQAKVEINEFVEYLRQPNKFTKLGAKLPKGALLTGPPGCGKTLLAKALAAESSVPFININGTEFVEMIGGLGASRVRKLFKEAKSRAPCIIYIDEIDAVGRKRQENDHMGGGHSEIEQTLNQLLVEMDGMDTAKGIVVIASTNRPDILDKALLRPGRFDRHIQLDLPTIIERKEMFDLYLQRIKKENRLIGISHRLASLTPGFSGADIANVVNEAAIHAATNQKKMVKMEDVHYALDKIIAGPEKRSRILVKEEREVVAFHESGHALVGWLLENTEALLKVTIIPRTSAALGFAQYLPKDRKLFTKEELFDRMCMMLGGRAAENVAFGRVTTGAQNDLEKVTKKAQAMVKWYGMNEQIGPLSFYPGPSADLRSAELMEKPYSKKMGNMIDQEVSKLVADAYYRTENLLKDNREKLDTLANELLKRETLNYEDVKRLIGPPKYGDKNLVDLPEDVLPEPIGI